MTSLTHASDNDLDMSSLDGYDSFDELTQESQSGFDAGQAARSYWLGKKFMNFAIAYNMLQDAGPEETAIDIDVRVEDILRRWPYTRSLKMALDAFESRLPHDLRSNTGEDYEAFMCALGYILLRSPAQNSLKLDAILESFCAEGDDWAETFGAKLGVGASEKTIDLAKNNTTKKGSGIDYYKTVKSHCQQKDETLRKSIEKVNERQTHENRWKTTLTTATREFQGRGRTANESTEKAAKQAYAKLVLGQNAE